MFAYGYGSEEVHPTPVASPSTQLQAAESETEPKPEPVTVYYLTEKEREKYIPVEFRERYPAQYSPPPFQQPSQEEDEGLTEQQQRENQLARNVILRLFEQKKRIVLGGEPIDPQRDSIFGSLRLWVVAISLLTLCLFIVIQSVLPDLETEHQYDSLWWFTLFLQCCVPILTIVNIIGFLLMLRVIIRYRRAEGEEMNTGFTLSRSSVLWVTVMEILIHIPQPCPYYYRRVYILSLLMFCRLYILLTIIEPLSSVFRDRFVIFRRAAGKYDAKVGARMITRIEVFRKTAPFFFMMAAMGAVFGTCLMYIVEVKPFLPADPQGWVTEVNWLKAFFWTDIWLFQVAQTPDFPSTNTGLLALFLICLFGWVLLVFLGAVITNLLKPSPIMLQIILFREQQIKEEKYKDACSKVVQNMWRASAAGDAEAKDKLRASLHRAIREKRIAASKKEEQGDNVRYATQLDTLQEREELAARVAGQLNDLSKDTLTDRKEIIKLGLEHHSRDRFGFNQMTTLLQEEHAKLKKVTKKVNPKLRVEEVNKTIQELDESLQEALRGYARIAQRHEFLTQRRKANDEEYQRFGDGREDIRAVRDLTSSMDERTKNLIQRIDSLALPMVAKLEKALSALDQRTEVIRKQIAQDLEDSLAQFDKLDARLDDLVKKVFVKCNQRIGEHLKQSPSWIPD